jgi:hypothetical protein
MNVGELISRLKLQAPSLPVYIALAEWETFEEVGEVDTNLAENKVILSPKKDTVIEAGRPK